LSQRLKFPACGKTSDLYRTFRSLMHCLFARYISLVAGNEKNWVVAQIGLIG